MDDLHDYDECVQIEEARCQLRDDCKEQGDPTFLKEFKKFDYDTCVAYAKEHCRTRKIGGGEWEKWTGKDVDRCSNAIKALYPTYCKDLHPSVDETEWLMMEEVCGFINEIEEDEPDIDAGPDAGE